MTSRRGFTALSMVRSACLAAAVSAGAAAIGDEPSPEGKAESAAERGDNGTFDSPAWQNTKAGLDEWFSLQTKYDAKAIEEAKKRLGQRLKKMSPDEREAFHRELDLKLTLVLGPDGRDLMAWTAANFAAAAPAYRKKLDLQTPDILSLSPIQVREQLDDLQRKRSAARSQSAALDQARQARIAALQAEQHQQYEERERSLNRGAAAYGSGGYRSPYHPSGMRKYPDVVSYPAYGWGFGFW